MTINKQIAFTSVVLIVTVVFFGISNVDLFVQDLFFVPQTHSWILPSDAQTHIGSLMWFNDKMAQEIDINKLKKDKNKKYSQDNLFDTLLGIFDVKTKVYNKKMDILHDD